MPYEQTFGTPPARPASDRSSAAAPDLVSDAAAAIAAIGRLEATIRSDRAAFLRLRAEAQAMAKAIADAKIALQAWAIKPDAAPGGKATELAALLLDLESRLHAMQFLMDFVCDGGTDAAARELDHVPTVSDVVSRLGRGGEAAAEDRDAAQPRPGGDDVPSVSMLGALVEALNASISATEPMAGVEPAANAAVGPDHGDAPAEGARPAIADAFPPTLPAPTVARAPEGDLLASFARMAAIPILAPETGTAVIFAGNTAPGLEPGQSSDAQPEPPAAQPAAETPAASAAARLSQHVMPGLVPGHDDV